MDPIHFLAQSAPVKARHKPATRQEIDRFYQCDDWAAVWRVMAVVRGLVIFGRRIGAKGSAMRQRSPIARTFPAE